MTTTAPSPRTRVKRVHDRGAYDRETIDAILDAGLICHIGYVFDGYPVVTPTIYWREDDHVYWHGSSASRMLRASEKAQVCLTVTHLDGLVLGRDGIAELIDRCCAMAHALTVGIRALPGAELIWEPTINQGLVRFLDSAPSATPADHDARTNAVIARIHASGEALFGGTNWRGMRCMRISVCGWQTQTEDVTRVIDAVRNVLLSNDLNGSAA